MTREDAINRYTVPALKRTWNDNLCGEILNALDPVVLWKFVHTEYKSWVECECGYQTLDSTAKYCPNCGGRIIWKKEEKNV